MKCDVEIKDFNIKNCYSVQCVPRELGTHYDMTAPLKRQNSEVARCFCLIEYGVQHIATPRPR